MHSTETLRGTARKQGGAAHKDQAFEVKTGSPDRKQPSHDRKRVETVVETLATLRGRSETLSEVAHDARNMVTALGLYCDLLEEPGVLATPFMHYGHELRLVAAASRSLVEKIVAIDAERNTNVAPGGSDSRATAQTAVSHRGAEEKDCSGSPNPADWYFDGSSEGSAPETNGLSRANAAQRNGFKRWELLPALPVANLAAELLANRNLLAALAGPAIALTVHAEGGARPVRLTGEDLTRVLVNLVKNAAEAMPAGGRIHIGLREVPAARGTADCLLVTVEDNGPGIPQDALESIFNSGYTVHGPSEGPGDGLEGRFALSHRGLGLTISRSIVEGAGGRIVAGNREHGGARFALELPVRNTSF